MATSENVRTGKGETEIAFGIARAYGTTVAAAKRGWSLSFVSIPSMDLRSVIHSLGAAVEVLPSGSVGDENLERVLAALTLRSTRRSAIDVAQAAFNTIETVTSRAPHRLAARIARLEAKSFESEYARVSENWANIDPELREFAEYCANEPIISVEESRPRGKSAKEIAGVAAGGGLTIWAAQHGLVGIAEAAGAIIAVSSAYSVSDLIKRSIGSVGPQPRSAKLEA